VPEPEDSSAALAPAELQRAALQGARPVLLARGVSEAVSFAAALALARLVSPSEYGHAVVALVVVTLALALTRHGLSAPLVQFPRLERSHLESAALLGIVLGGALTVGTALLAPVAFGPLFGERTAALIRLASPAFLLSGLATGPYAIVQRRLDFRRTALVETGSLVVGAVTAVAAAAAGLGATAVVLGALVGLAAASALWLLSARPVRPRWNRAAVRDVATFGLASGGAALAYEGFLNVDYAILAARVSPARVGFYWRAWQLGVGYQAKLSGLMLAVGFPVYARTRNLEELRRVRDRLARLNAIVLFPLLALLVAVAPVLVPTFFGARWSPAVRPTQILALAGMCLVAGTGIAPMLFAAGKPRAQLWLNVGGLVAYAALIGGLATARLTILCAAIAVFHVAWLGCQWAVARHEVDLPLRSLWNDLAPALAGSLVLLAVTYPLVRVLQDALPAGPILAVAAGVAAVLYLATLRALYPEALVDLRLVTRQVLLGRSS
jgi:O-antigen/teichoic acid export membrane protein